MVIVVVVMVGSSEARVQTSWWLGNRNWPIVQASKPAMPSVRGSI